MTTTDPELDAIVAEWRREREAAAVAKVALAARREAYEAELAVWHARAEAEAVRRARLAAAVPASLVAEVRAYATDHYTDGGWDVIVECWSDADIAHAIGGATTLLGARRKLATVVSVFADHEADARNSAF